MSKAFSLFRILAMIINNSIRGREVPDVFLGGTLHTIEQNLEIFLRLAGAHSTGAIHGGGLDTYMCYGLKPAEFLPGPIA